MLITDIQNWTLRPHFSSIIFSWSIGYNGSPIHFIDSQTICYLNGNCVKFVNIESGSVRYLQSPGNGISNLAVNPVYGYIAFNENGLKARIFIYHIDDLNKPYNVLSGIFGIFLVL